MHPQEFGAAHSLHCSTIDGQWQVLGEASLEIDNNLLGHADIQQEIVVSALCGQKVDLPPVVGLVTNHQSCDVRKLHYVVGAVGCCAVVCQQGEEQGNEHTAFGAPVLSVMLCCCKHVLLVASDQEVQQPVAQGDEGAEPQFIKFADEFLGDYSI